MKTSERHHLKENEFALATGHALEAFEQNRGTYLAIVGAILLILVAVGGYAAWSNNRDANARTLLAEAMVVYEARVAPPAPSVNASPGAPAVVQPPGTYPTEKARLEAALPKLQAAADAYPATEPGLNARYILASVLVDLTRYDDAIREYDRIAADADGMLDRMAALGKAEAQLRAGRHDDAIAGFKALADSTDTNLPAEAVKMELARAYKVAGKTEDARKTLNEIIEKHADSPFAAEAKTELERLKG